MKLAHRWPAALLALAACGTPVLAQPGAPAQKDLPPAVRQGGGADSSEDVEIMRRLLERALGEAYGLPAAKPGAVRGLSLDFGFPVTQGYTAPRNVAGEGTHPSPLVEGVHLKDFGVFYTATLPYPGFNPVLGLKPDAGPKPPLDPWERTRKELRGETPEPEGKFLPAHQPLSEVILKVLAENGRHFTSLADGERVVVAVTFRGAAGCANCHQNPSGNNSQPLATFRWAVEAVDSPTPPTPADALEAPGSADPNAPRGPYTIAPAGTGTAPSWQNDVRSDVLLGDLHLKQGKGQEAVAAYLKAVQELEKGIDRKRYQEKGYIPADLPVLLAGVDLYTKLAQAFTALGNDGEARKVLQIAGRLAKEAEALTGGAPTTKAPASAALPGKLVVTASKKLLDDVGSGKMTFEAFYKAATVEYTAGAGGASQPESNQPAAGGK